MEVKNLSHDFLKFYQNIDLNDSEKVIYAAFQQNFGQEDYYRAIFRGLKKRGEDIPSFLKQKLEEFSSIKVRFKELSNSFETTLEEISSVFKDYFGDFTFAFPIIVGHSLGAFDGGIREGEEGNPLFVFGFDVMARVYRDIPMTAFFMHELFHVYHRQHYNELNDASIVNSLWVEGLATYFSHITTPDATRQEILLDNPPGLIEKTRQSITLLCNLILKNLDTMDMMVYRRLFLGPFNQENFRSGYYIGYLFAAYMGIQYNLSEIVHLSGKQLLKPLKTFIHLCLSDFTSIEAQFLDV